MTTPDRLAAAVAQGHEDAVQAWPQEDRAPYREEPCVACGRADCEPRGPLCCEECEHPVLSGWWSDAPAPVSPPAGEDAQDRAGTAEVAEVRRAFRLDPGCHEDMGDGPCGEATVAARIDSGCGDPYPVCIEHVRAVMVPLASLIRQDPPQVAGEDVERVARVLFITEAGCDNPATAERLWSNLTARMPVTEWHRQAEEVLAALSARPVEGRRTADTLGGGYAAGRADGPLRPPPSSVTRPARPVEAQEVAAEDALRAEAWAAEARRERELGNQARAERDAALARAEAAEAVIEKVRAEVEQAESCDYLIAPEYIRALLDTDSENGDDRG